MDEALASSLVVTLSHTHLVLAPPSLPFDQSVLPWLRLHQDHSKVEECSGSGELGKLGTHSGLFSLETMYLTAQSRVPPGPTSSDMVEVSTCPPKSIFFLMVIEQGHTSAFQLGGAT